MSADKRNFPPTAPSPQEFYLITSSSEAPTLGPGTAFYKTANAAMAESLVRLFAKEYGSDNQQLQFAAVPSNDLSLEDRILLDEALVQLEVYDDPDIGIYDPPPAQQTMDRARYARRATTWEGMIQSRSSSKAATSAPGSDHQSQSPKEQIADDDSVIETIRNLVSTLTEFQGAVLGIINAAADGRTASEMEIKKYCDSRQAAETAVGGSVPHLAGVFRNSEEIAVALAKAIRALEGALDPLLSRSTMESGAHPISKDVIETAREKLGDFMVHELSLSVAVSDPGKSLLPPEEDRALGIALLLVLAQAYYKILECAVSTANWCTSLDLQLNHHYLWTVNNLTNLLKNQESLKDFPGKFDPAFPDLFPTTIRDVDWDDMVAPEAERFLAAVQKYAIENPTCDLPKHSGGWLLVEALKESTTHAVNYAIAYNARMRQYIKKAFGVSSPPTTPETDIAAEPAVGANTEPLPVAKPKNASSVILGPKGEPCQVLGKAKGALTDGQYAIVEALLKVGNEGLSKDALEAIRPSARRMLKDLRDKDSDWATVIIMPRQTNGRYRVRR